MLDIVKLTDVMEISPITMPAKLLILGYGWNRIRLENEQILVNLTVPITAPYVGVVYLFFFK